MAVATANRIDLDDTGFTDEELFERVPQDAAAVEKITAPRYSYWHSVFRVFFRKKTNILILVLLAFIIVFTYVYPAVMGYDRYGNIMDSAAKHLSPHGGHREVRLLHTLDIRHRRLRPVHLRLHVVRRAHKPLAGASVHHH